MIGPVNGNNLMAQHDIIFNWEDQILCRFDCENYNELPRNPIPNSLTEYHDFINNNSFDFQYNNNNLYDSNTIGEAHPFELENQITNETIANINIIEEHIDEVIPLYQVFNRSDGLIRQNPNLNSSSSNIMGNNNIISQNIIQNPEFESELINPIINALNRASPNIRFEIKKLGYIGKYPKECSNKTNNPEVHTKFEEDNMKNVIITRAFQSYEDHNNLMLRKSKDNTINKITLKRINLKLIKDAPVKELKEILGKYIKDILSGPLSGRYKCWESNYNEKMIKKIMESGDERIKNEMTKKGWHIFEVYSKKKQDIYLFEEMKTIDEDIDRFLKRGESIEYINSYRETALNFEAIIRKKIPRRR